MATTEYIGARYVPVFADPAEWNSKRTYEPLTIVQHEGNSYTSKQYVPVGVDILNEDFWANTGNYNAQVEQYRRDTENVKNSLDSVKASVTAETTRAKAAESANAKSISDETTRAKAAESANAKSISDETTRAKAAESANAAKITSNTKAIETLEEKGTLVIFGDSWTDFKNHPDWCTLANIPNILNVNVQNFGISGATQTNIVSTQIPNALSAITGDARNKVKYIVIVEGINDTHGKTILDFNFLNWQKIVLQIGNTLHANFPNAKIVYQLDMCLPTYNWAQSQLLYQMWERSSTAISGGYAQFGASPFWWMNHPPNTFYVEDQAHLNELGAQFLGNIILKLLTGGLPYFVSYSKAIENTSLNVALTGSAIDTHYIGSLTIPINAATTGAFIEVKEKATTIQECYTAILNNSVGGGIHVGYSSDGKRCILNNNIGLTYAVEDTSVARTYIF